MRSSLVFFFVVWYWVGTNAPYARTLCLKTSSHFHCIQDYSNEKAVHGFQLWKKRPHFHKTESFVKRISFQRLTCQFFKFRSEHLRHLGSIAIIKFHTWISVECIDYIINFFVPFQFISFARKIHRNARLPCVNGFGFSHVLLAYVWLQYAYKKWNELPPKRAWQYNFYCLLIDTGRR